MRFWGLSGRLSTQEASILADITQKEAEHFAKESCRKIAAVTIPSSYAVGWGVLKVHEVLESVFGNSHVEMVLCSPPMNAIVGL